MLNGPANDKPEEVTFEPGSPMKGAPKMSTREGNSADKTAKGKGITTEEVEAEKEAQASPSTSAGTPC